MQVDQAGCHRAKRLRVPSNTIFIFQPAHSPQLNPIERVWLHLKQGYNWADLPKDLAPYSTVLGLTQREKVM